MYVPPWNLKDILTPAHPESTELRHDRRSNTDTHRNTAEKLWHPCWLSDPGQYVTSLHLSFLICQNGS